MGAVSAGSGCSLGPFLCVGTDSQLRTIFSGYKKIKKGKTNTTGFHSYVERNKQNELIAK